MTLVAGTRLGPYEIEGLLGVGGMGEVYRATDPRLGRKVAVKVLPSEMASDSARLSLFEREARAVAALNHPNILTVHDVGTHDGTPYVVTELLEGETLRELVSRRKPTVPQILTYMLQAARGLEAAHAKGIVHRDLKPENLFLTTDGRVKVLDFGLAKLVRSEAEITSDVSTAAHSTPSGQVAGTVLYMSPEQARAQAIDVRSDVFSFGVVLHELLAGQHPFRKDTVAGTLTSIVEETPAGLESLGRSIPPTVAGIVRRCLQKEREDRYASGHDVAMVLEAVAAAPSGAAVLQEVEERSPYPGLRSFTEKDEAVFFGREREIEELWGRIPNRKLLGVIGPSGAGKTSFVRAGVLPARPEGWGAVVSTPGTAPTRHLAQALARELSGDPDAVQRLLRFDEPDAVVETVSRWRENHGEALLVVDQFEELLTLSPPGVQESFAALLGRLAADADVHVLLSLRDDFLIRCCELEPLTPVLRDLTALLALTPQDLRRAIEEPAKKQGYRFEDEALVAEMVEAVEGARAALPLLAFAVSCLWERRDRGKKVLTRAAYEDIGGIAGGLAQHAEATMDRIGPERQNVVREMFRNLVTAQGTRAVIERDELLSTFPDREIAEAVLRHLIDARLLTSYEVDGDGGQVSQHRIEVVHESLLKAWPRLVRWQTQDEDGAQLRDQLRQAAHLWEDKERSPDVLWTGSAYQEFELWRDRYQGKLTALEDAYAHAMLDRVQRHRRVRRVALAGVVLASLAVAAVVSVMGFREARARAHAEAETQRAEASKLLALAQLRLGEDPTEALALSTASLELSDSEEARIFALRTLSVAPPALELDGEGVSVRAPAFSPDGEWLAAAGHSPEAGLWRSDGTGPVRLPGHEPNPNGSIVAAWPGDDLLVTGLCCGYAEQAHVWSVPDGDRVHTLEFGRATYWGVSPGRVLTLTDAGPSTGRYAVRSWSLPHGEQESFGFFDPGAVGTSLVRFDFDPGGAALLYARGREVFRRPLTNPPTEVEERLTRHPAGVAFVLAYRRASDGFFSSDQAGELRLFRPDVDGAMSVTAIPAAEPWTPSRRDSVDSSGRWVLQRTGQQQKEAVLRKVGALPQARPLRLRRRASWQLSSRDVCPEGGWFVASTSNWNRLTFWPLGRPRPTVLDGYGSSERLVAFSPDGRWLATHWPPRSIRLWPVPGQGSGEVRTLQLPSGGQDVTSIVFAPDNQYILVADSGQAYVVPLDGAPVRPLEGFSRDSLLFAGAVSPSGHRAASAFFFGTGNKELRVWDLETGETMVFDLPVPEAATEETGFEGAVASLHFVNESTLYAGGHGGIQRWDLDAGTHEIVVPTEANRHSFLLMSADGQTALTAELEIGTGERDPPPQIRDMQTGTSRPLRGLGDVHGGVALDPSGRIVAAGDRDGVLRVGHVDGSGWHLLLGHEGPMDRVAISPDQRWVASTAQDNTLRLWPMPDLDKPPLQTLPRDELIARLKSLTNIRAVRDPEDPTGWAIELGPFPGWKEVPAW